MGGDVGHQCACLPPCPTSLPPSPSPSLVVRVARRRYIYVCFVCFLVWVVSAFSGKCGLRTASTIFCVFDKNPFGYRSLSPRTSDYSPDTGCERVTQPARGTLVGFLPYACVFVLLGVTRSCPAALPPRGPPYNTFHTQLNTQPRIDSTVPGPVLGQQDSVTVTVHRPSLGIPTHVCSDLQ